MRITPASDLHLEFPNADRRRALDFPHDVDVIVLAGDIGIGTSTAEEALALASQFPSAHVVWVAGNHEFYRHNIDNLIEQYRALCAGHDRVHFLENNAVDIGSWRFIGCTLWTDFSVMGDPAGSMYVAERGVSDFELIQTRTGRFAPRDAAERFERSREYLERELIFGRPEKTVVVSHFPPGLATRNQRFWLNPIAAYFQANVDDLIDRYQPALWIYGHNHFSNDLQRGATRLVSNQMGYPSETGLFPGYHPDKTILLSNPEGIHERRRSTRANSESHHQ